MHLYTTLQHKIGLKADACWGEGTLGSKIRLVSLMQCGIIPISKNSCTASQTRVPILCQVALKKPLLYPSSPGDLKLGMEDMACLISDAVNGLHKVTCGSSVKQEPCEMMSKSIVLLGPTVWPRNCL